MMDNNVRVHIWVRGRVQGVGFRAFVAASAQTIGVTGWVRNVSWDTVEAIAEGDQARVHRFIQAVKTGPSASRVDESRLEEETYRAEFTGFDIDSSR